MQYTFLFYEDPSGFAIRTDPELSGPYRSGIFNYIDALREAGVLVASTGLHPPETATTLRPDGDTYRVQDGPFAEVKEHLGGLIIVNVPNLDSALEWAARFPKHPGSAIEVRPNLTRD